MKNEVVMFGSGCFWCSEAVFKQLKGIQSVTPGYAGGTVANPSYEQVCTGETGHAEVVKIEYDEDVIKFEDLLTVFFATHDPTALNRQGHDIGEQYRSVIFYTDESQRQEAERFITKLENDKLFDGKIVTAVEFLTNFYEAEDYHKDYYSKNPDKAYCQANINPKLSKLHERFGQLIRK
ncbi:peptide-methionine (S)-S-oxide reductase MsrA [Patescibacteria group bacterium]|nr:peptide-methionine (S)-S-oxide reductase MsrA [Patescibacteria group bacterium]